ncbi:hypothetical protein BL250_10530 [Erwinia sp. OLTSP20]|uniref:ATPase, T2SS/T4P/T4SS family n=1 Tax=unclassified Erwinia TaxID=2622719 RepID=UPI000C18616A|nr:MULTISPECIES: ATPase, T2SS/T4P/T4SS family [unclassified Erwinia]PIJ49835.1 hypothetical protein BV501_11660 [Erwinia sp. OAMSP11]PIJ70934.1 hypothetical protein BK416_12850 [Erwinia sp. OLSSP12]PIJ80300.1 hypothetical protein BLD47_11715 [Erwinia sp. OLCASP19]PIJ82424.1 hypothetical protein BLD46_11465 [Erwinia sp. OLMTSP26]PIJ85109.1 hypothetical protein BLD49_11575 [Erwinia sp. OLMDSP33]
MELGSKKLIEITFSDLIFTHDEGIYFRHVTGYDRPVVQLSGESELSESLIELKKQLTTIEHNEFFYSWEQVPFRVTRIITVNGENYFLRRPMYPVPKFDSLGYREAHAKQLQSLRTKSGLVIFSGATGSGKSTSMYSLMTDFVSESGDIVISIEDPPEIPVATTYGEPDVKGLWYQVNAADAGGYCEAMISAMRYNPKYIMMGEIRSAESANQAIRAAVNGHIVLTTIHGGSLQGTIMALQQIAAAGMGSQELARSIIADGLIAVVHQRLIKGKVPGSREMRAEMLFINDDGMRSKIRSGKLELLSTEIYTQNKIL